VCNDVDPSSDAYVSELRVNVAKTILITVNSWKGASGHAALHAQVEDLLSKDAGNESVVKEIEEVEPELRQDRTRLVLSVISRRLSDLRFIWSWGLWETWITMFHVGLFVLTVVSVLPVVVLNFLNVFVSLLSRVPAVGYVTQVLVDSPLDSLTSRATDFCGDVFLFLYFKTFGDQIGDFNDMSWLLFTASPLPRGSPGRTFQNRYFCLGQQKMTPIFLSRLE